MTPAVMALLAYETALDGTEPTLGNRIAAMEAALKAAERASHGSMQATAGAGRNGVQPVRAQGAYE